jgi:hypothetical protein
MQFSISEILAVTLFVSLTAGSILRHAQGNKFLLVLGAVSIGLAAAGPWVLTMRRRNGAIAGRWGIGEIAWLAIGANFLIMLLWNLLFAPEKAAAERWLIAACLLCAAALLATVVISLVRWLTVAMGASTPSDRRWFVNRPTNVIGIALVVWFSLLGSLLLLLEQI